MLMEGYICNFFVIHSKVCEKVAKSRNRSLQQKTAVERMSLCCNAKFLNKKFIAYL